MKAVKYFEYLMSESTQFIHHQLNGGEKILLGKYHVDGFTKGLNGSPDVVYEFAGCFFHGHPCKYSAETKSTFHACTFGELHTKFVDRIQTLKKAGYHVKVLWECEYEKKFATDEHFREFVENCSIESPLIPGDALFGG